MIGRWVLTTFFVISFGIGISFITLPFVVNLAGFWPSLITIAVLWFYLLATSYYYLEAALSMPPGANVYSISKKYTRQLGTWLNSLFFILVNGCNLLFFFYVGIPLLGEIFYRAGLPWPQLLSYLFFGVILGGAISLGFKWTIRLNFLLLLAVGIIFYLGLHSKIEAPIHNTSHPSFKFGFLILIVPALISSLYIQTLIPCLVSYLDRNVKLLKSSIFWGLSLACLICLGWLWMILSTTNLGMQSLNQGNSDNFNFNYLNQFPIFGKWFPYLAILSLSTAILGCGIILVDFFSDYFGIPVEKRNGKRSFVLAALFLPLLLCAPLISSASIIKIIRIIIDIGSLYLCGLLPIWWIWSLRYEHQEEVPPLVPGGKKLLIALTALSCFLLYLVGLEILFETSL